MIICYVTIIEQSTAQKWLRYCFSPQKLKKKSSILFWYFIQSLCLIVYKLWTLIQKNMTPVLMESQVVSISTWRAVFVPKNNGYGCFAARTVVHSLQGFLIHSKLGVQACPLPIQLPRDWGAQLQNQERCYLLSVLCLCHDLDCPLKLFFLTLILDLIDIVTHSIASIFLM